LLVFICFCFFIQIAADSLSTGDDEMGSRSKGMNAREGARCTKHIDGNTQYDMHGNYACMN